MIISCRLNVRFNMQSCVHSFFFFLPDRPTHLHEREGYGKRNILWGLPKHKLAYIKPGGPRDIKRIKGGRDENVNTLPEL